MWKFINGLRTGKQVVIAETRSKFSFRTPETAKARLGKQVNFCK